MIYTLIGKAVVKGVRAYVRQRYGPTYAPKPVLAGLVVVAALAAALAAAKREES